MLDLLKFLRPDEQLRLLQKLLPEDIFLDDAVRRFEVIAKIISEVNKK